MSEEEFYSSATIKAFGREFPMEEIDTEFDIDAAIVRIESLDDFKKEREAHKFTENELISIIQHFAGGREVTDFIFSEGKINPLDTIKDERDGYWDVLSLDLANQSFRACVPWQRRFILHEWLCYAPGIYGDDSPTFDDLKENKTLKESIDGMIGCEIGKLSVNEMKYFDVRYWTREKFFRDEEESIIAALEKSDRKTFISVFHKAIGDEDRYDSKSKTSEAILDSWDRDGMCKRWHGL